MQLCVALFINIFVSIYYIIMLVIPRLRWYFLLGILLLNSLLVCARPLPVPADSIAANQANTLLWRVSGQKLSTPSYVFGTMHLLCPEDASITQEMAAAFDGSAQLVMELDINAPEYSMRFVRAARMPWSNSLRKLVKPQDYKLLRQFFQKQLQQPLAPLTVLKPTLLEAFVCGATLSCKPVSYEDRFAELAKTQHKQVLGLETIEEQMASLDRVPLQRQAESLVETVREFETTKKLMHKLVDVYHTQNVEKLYQLGIDPEFNSDNSAQEELAELRQRNQNWIPKMTAAMSSGATFFAVGAAHLGGPTGVLELLRLQGYQVEPVLLHSSIAK